YVDRLTDFALGPDPRPMLVTGIGGVGKSALLAGLVQRWRDADRIAVILDFDRPELSTGEPMRIGRDFAPQVQTAGPDVPDREQARECVQKARQAIRDIEEGGSVWSAESQVSFLVSEVYPQLQRGSIAVPILLVLDSFESVGVLGAIVVRRIIDVVN